RAATDGGPRRGGRRRPGLTRRHLPRAAAVPAPSPPTRSSWRRPTPPGAAPPSVRARQAPPATEGMRGGSRGSRSRARSLVHGYTGQLLLQRRAGAVQGGLVAVEVELEVGQQEVGVQLERHLRRVDVLADPSLRAQLVNLLRHEVQPAQMGLADALLDDARAPAELGAA